MEITNSAVPTKDEFKQEQMAKYVTGASEEEKMAANGKIDGLKEEITAEATA